MPMYACPGCEEPINPASEVCPYCGVELVQTNAGGEAAPSQGRRVSRMVMLWAVVLIGLIVILWMALPWRLGGSKGEAEAHARTAVVELEQALTKYKAAEHTFPSSLEPLGTAARQAVREAQAGRYTLQYSPGTPESDGSIGSYTLTARAGNYGYVNLFADESGQVHGTRENRAASVQDPIIEVGH